MPLFIIHEISYFSSVHLSVLLRRREDHIPFFRVPSIQSLESITYACMHVSRLEASNLKSDQTILLSCTADGAETETRWLRPPYQTGKRRSRFREYNKTVKINPGIGADFVVSNLASIGLFRPVSSKSSLLTPSPPTRPRTRIWTLDHGFPFVLIFALSYQSSRTLNAVKVRLAHLSEPDAKWITATAIGLLLQCYTSNKERRHGRRRRRGTRGAS